MLLATPENMEKCKDIPGVVALDIEKGEQLSATVGDYFWASKPKPILSWNKKPLVLAVKVCHWVDPISGEPLPAQITAERS